MSFSHTRQGLSAVAAPFVGRDDVLGLLASAMRETRGGRPGLVVIEGAPGVGKTTLVDRFLGGVEGARVVKVWGTEAEILERFSLVGQLLRQLQRGHMGTAIDATVLADDEVTEVGGRLLAALEPDIAPTVILVDDAQWADGVSMQALSFALRRLESDSVLTLICTRSLRGETETLVRLVEATGGQIARLGGLSPPEVGQLAKGFGVDLSPAAARRLWEHTGGLPLHLSSLLDELDPTTLSRAHGPLPAPRSFATLVLRRLAECPPQVEALVTAAAVLGDRARLTTAARVGGVADPVSALDGAVAAGLLQHRRERAGDEVSFVHDLVRVAVIDALAPARRVTLHRCAAATLSGVEALEQRAAAAMVPDAGLAAELSATGRAEARRGATETAVHHLLEASRISPDPAIARTLRLDAVEALLLGGATVEAKGLTADLQSELDDDPDRARVSYLRGHLALLDGRRGEAERLLIESWDRVEAPRRPRLAALVAAQLSQLCTTEARNTEAATWAARAASFAGDDSALATTAVGTLLTALVFSGQPEEALARALPDEATATALTEHRFDDVGGRGLVRLWTDDLAGARSDLQAVTEPSRRACPLRTRLISLGFLTEVHYRAGRWDEASVTGDLAVSLAEDADHVWLLGLLHGMVALPAAGRGTWTSAQAHIDAAEAAGAAIGDVMNLAYPAVAATALAAARGDHLGVLSATDVIAAMDPTRGALEPTVLLWWPARVEALVAEGRLDEAAALLDLAEPFARARARRSALVGLARSRGALEAARGNTAEAIRAFEDGAALVPDLGMPFEAGLLRLAFGAQLRRIGQRRRAAEQLHAALDNFAVLRATPYVDRAQLELAACGLTPRGRGPSGPILTAREQAVASLVAEGLTNREVARRLVVSTKTVEYHLGNAFLKLGVSSRAQLVALLAASGRGGPED